MKKTKVSIHVEEIALSNPIGDQAKFQAEASIKKGEEQSPFTPGKSAIDTAEKQPSTEIGSPIQSIMPIQSSRGNPSIEVVFIEDLMPISVEEMPPSSIFFSERRKVVLKREIHQREGVPIKKHRVLYDG
jgi:hypothetical protein